MSNIRCKWYNNEGHPRPNPILKRSLGCEFHGRCHFVHPDNPEWENARLSFPPGPVDWNGEDRPLTPPPDSKHNLISMQRRRDRTPTRPRGRSKSRERDGNIYPSRSYSFQNRRRPSRQPSSIDSPRSPVLSGTERNRDSGWSGYKNLPHPSHNHSVERDDQRRHSIDSRVPSKDGSRGRSDSIHLPPSRPPTPPELRTERKQPPQPPSHPPPPPPPVPVINSDTNILSKPPEIKEMSAKEKTKMWQDRLKLLADACNARVEYQKLEEEQGSWKAILNNRAYRDLSENAQATLDSSVEDLQKKMDAVKKRSDEIVENLVTSSFWPVLHQQYNGWETAFEEVKRLTENVVTKVDEHDRTIKSFVDTKQDDLSDTRGTKRRRLSPEGAEGPISVATDSSPRPQALPEDIEPQLRNQIESLDGHIGEIENQLVQQESELAQLFEEKIDEKTEEIVGQNIKLKQATEMRLNDLDENYSTLDSDVKELASYVTQLYTNFGLANEEMEKLRREREEMKEKLAEFESRCKKDEDEIANMKLQLHDAIEETRVLNALYRQSIKGPTPIPLPEPDTASPEAIAAVIQPQIVKAVREDIQPLVIELRKYVEDILSTRNTEIYNKVWPKMHFVMEVGKALKIQLDGKSTNLSIAK